MNTKTRKTTGASAGTTNSDAVETDNVDKIRDILFGNQMREVSQRFANLEKNLAKDLAALRNENALQIDSLKTFIESEIEILGSKLSGEEQSRVENVDELDDKLKQQVKQIDKNIGDVVNSLDKNSRDINQKILKQSQDFSSELSNQIGEARSRMDGHRQELSAAKVDKQVLSEMLNALALQVNPDESKYRQSGNFDGSRMNDKGHEDGDRLEELRRLLVGVEREQIEQLHDKLDVPENFSSQVGEVLPQAMLKSSARGTELSQVMVPVVEDILRLSIKKDIDKFADALFPVIGPAIRKSIRETFRQMMQSLNQTLEHSLSWQGVKWRLESARTGVPFAQIALLHGLVYRVEQVFLIHRDSGLLLCHLGQDDVPNQDPDLVSSMLSAINDFVGVSFEVEAERNLNSIEIGDISIWLEVGPDTVLAVAIRGEAPNHLRTFLQQTLEQVQQEFSDALENFKGDTGKFEDRQDILQGCLQAQYQGEPKEKSPGSKGKSSKLIIIVLAAIMLSALGYWLVSELYRAHRHETYLAGLDNEPGYVVTDSYYEDGVLIVQGLRDPSSRRIESLLPGSPLQPAEVKHRFKPYQSLDAEFVERRARKILNPPAGVTLVFGDNMIRVTGIADLAWRQHLQSRMALIAGIDSYDDTALKTQFAESMLAPPPGVSMQLEAGVLYVEGAAENEWILSLAAAAEQFAEIETVDTRALVNLTEVSLVEQIAQLEQQAVFFEAATSYDFDSIDVPKITALCGNIIELANQLARSVLIVVRGHSDSVGSFEDNRFLSRERADFVAQAIFNSGIGPRYIAVKGIESAVEPESSEAERRYNRRVGFEVFVE